MSNDRIVEVTIQPCKFCGSLRLQFFRNSFDKSMMCLCECGAVVSFKMPDQSTKAFFERWNGSAHKAEIKLTH